MAGATIQFKFENSEIRKLMAAMDPRPALDDFGNYMVRRVTRVFQRGSRESRAAAGQPPFVRSGGRGIVGSITYDLDNQRLAVGTNKIYGAQLQFGGEIRAKDKLLTVPIAAEAKGKRAADFGDLKFVFAPKGDRVGLLVRPAKKENALGRVIFALFRRVVTAPHPWLFWLKEDADKLLGLLRARFDAR
jgi:phage gpG-like protein